MGGAPPEITERCVFRAWPESATTLGWAGWRRPSSPGELFSRCRDSAHRESPTPLHLAWSQD